jgi:cytochrome c oxidase subunit 2
VVALAAVIPVVALAALGGSSNDPLTIDVFANQYSWHFGYPDHGNAYSGREVHVPLGRQVQFEMHSPDVVHAFWVPEWKIKKDIPPGETTTAAVTPDKAGTFELICAELCGIEHGSMRAKLVVESEAAFTKWVDSLNQTVPAHFVELIHIDTELESIHIE